MSAFGAVSRVRVNLSESARRRAARRRLERELAEFRTPAEQLELEAMIERHLEIEYEVAEFRKELPEFVA